ncbi:MAG TPA: hypothetical protein PLV58_01330 [Campylobacterales bacterium]|nr:hypothetical protein [Campylobacterales bacterium]
MKRYVKKISQVSAFGSMAVLAALALGGCGEKPKEQPAASGSSVAEASKAQGQFLVIQEIAKDKYKVVEQYPANGPSRAILKEMNGTEKLLSEEELKKLAEVEAKKVENNTSNLTKENSAQMHGGGMSLGETILASAAGALIGGYIANKLFNNPNFQNNQRMNTPSQMSQPVNKAPSAASSAANSGAKPQSGFFKQTPTQAPATPSGSPSSSSSSSSSGSSGSKSFGG